MSVGNFNTLVNTLVTRWHREVEQVS